MCYNSRSWQNPSNREDNPTPVPEEKKIMGLDLSKSKTHPARKITTSCSTPSIMKNSAMTSNSATISNSNMFSVKMATNMQSPGNKCKTWGPPCLFCVQSILHPSQLDSDWSEEEWEQEIEKEKSGEKQRKEEMLWRQAEEKKVLSSNHYPLVPMYIPNHKDKTPTVTSDLILAPENPEEIQQDKELPGQKRTEG